MADEPKKSPWWDRVAVVLKVGQYLVMTLLGFGAAVLTVPPRVDTVEVEKPVPLAATGPDGDGPRAMGWSPDPAAVDEVVKTLPIKAFAATPAMGADLPEKVFLWDAAKKAIKAHIPTRNQKNIGSCVAHGGACAVEYLQVVQIAGGRSFEFKAASQEVIYGGSRVQVGQGRIRGDGSVGAWAAKWCRDWGVVPRGIVAGIDLQEYDVERCRRYGDAGCPDVLIPVAKLAPVKSVTLVKTTDEARAALANGYPVTVASDVGFGPTGGNVRDADGFLRASGSWAHQMCLIGYQTGRRPGFYCMNSWGPSWVSGPTGAGDPPPGGFWIDDRTVARMLSQGDSWAYADMVGFPKRPEVLNWFIRKPARDPLARLELEVALAW